MPTLYQTALGPHFTQLAPLLQRFHREPGQPWRGEARVVWSQQPLLRALLWLARLPAEGDAVPVAVQVAARPGRETWQRRFAGRRMASRQRLASDGLREGFGPFSLLLSNQVANGALQQRCIRSRWLGLPLPRGLGLNVVAQEWAETDRFHFDVAIALGPLALIRYTGWLLPSEGDGNGHS